MGGRNLGILAGQLFKRYNSGAQIVTVRLPMGVRGTLLNLTKQPDFLVWRRIQISVPKVMLVNLK